MAKEGSPEKKFVLTDENLNVSGFWLVTAGGDFTQFKRNPLMLWMHNRVWRGTTDEVLPIGTWEGLTVTDKNEVVAAPVFDDSDEFAARIKGKVDKNVLRMASVGIRVIETSSDKKYLKPGQTRETITKWQLVEASIVDFGRNENALAFYDSADNLLTFAEDSADNPVKLLKQPNSNKYMSELTSALNLADTATEQEIAAAVAAQAKEVKALKAAAQAELDALAVKQKTEADTLLKEAFKDGRLTADAAGTVQASWQKLFEADHAGACAALAAITKPRTGRAEVGGDTEYKAGSIWERRLAEIRESNGKK